MRITGIDPANPGGTKEVGVTENGRLQTLATTRPIWVSEALKGNMFWVHSGYISLTTTASFSAVFYLKNDESDKRIHVRAIRTCGTGTGYNQIRIYSNPGNGTLVSGGTSITPVNALIGDSTELNATALKGADGSTVTDGTMMGTWTDDTPGYSEQPLDGDLILLPGQAVAIEVQPSVATEFCTSWRVWVEDKGAA